MIKWRWWAGFVSLLLVFLSAFDYFYGANSEAMSFARTTLEASTILEKRIGSVHSVDLDWIWGYSEKSRYAGIKATLRLSVTGASGNEHIVMIVQQIDGQWRVIRSSTPI